MGTQTGSDLSYNPTAEKALGKYISQMSFYFGQLITPAPKLGKSIPDYSSNRDLNHTNCKIILKMIYPFFNNYNCIGLNVI